jgi:hypothetical protein
MRKLSILILLVVAGMTLCGLFSSRKVLEIPSETMAAPVVPEPEISPFDQAVEIIKKYEGLHSRQGVSDLRRIWWINHNPP